MKLKTPDNWYFKVVRDEVDAKKVELIAEGNGVDIRDWLNTQFADGHKCYWRKYKVWAYVQRRSDGKRGWADVHWFEAHGVGKVEIKIKGQIT